MINTVSFKEVILDSAKEVFETMIFMDLDESSEPEQEIKSDALLGTLTFEGNIEGCIGICCSTSCANDIAAAMLGTEPDKSLSNNEICDALGEITNMIMGKIESLLQDQVGKLKVSIPSVTTGRELKNNLGDGAERFLVKVNIQDEHIAELSLLYRETRN